MRRKIEKSSPTTSKTSKTWRTVQPWLVKGAAFLVATVVLACLCLAVSHVTTAQGRFRRAAAQAFFHGAGSQAGTDAIHVCLTSDSADLRAAAVAIQSAYTNAASPDRLVFHLITTPELVPVFQELVRAHLPDIAVKVVADQVLQDQIASRISFRKTSKARKVLASPFNFAPFYLHEYVKEGGQPPRRLIYLDTDTVIMGDLGELQDIDLQGHSCASVKYCLQRLNNYVDFEALRELGFTDFDPEACIANRGLLVIDVQRWLSQGLTEKIEFWMQKYKESSKDLWRGGMSQPPWLLAMKNDFLDLGDEWNCNSLGRENMVYEEARVLRETGFDHAAVQQLGAKVDESGGISPYVVSCSQTGKLLHYNGAVKPWKGDYAQRKLPVCALPDSITLGKQFRWSSSVKLFCKPVNFVHCLDIWKSYISDDTACALRDFQEEWSEEEPIWAAARHEEMEKLDAQKKAKQKERIHKQEIEKEEIKAREMVQAALQNADESSNAAQQREREAEFERWQLEQRDSPDPREE